MLLLGWTKGLRRTSIALKSQTFLAEFIEEYKLEGHKRDSWIYFEIPQDSYGLPQAGILANDLLWSCLLSEGYYKAKSTPGFWCHKWCPIQICLIVDDFGVEYVGLGHFNQVHNVLKKFHGVQFNMAGNKFAGINIKWDYATCQCHISMPGYIENLLIKFEHPHPTKPCLSLHKCLPMAYGAKAQLTSTANTSEQLEVCQYRFSASYCSQCC